MQGRATVKRLPQYVALAVAVIICVVIAVAFVARQSTDRARAEALATQYAAQASQTPQTEVPVAITVVGDDLSAPAQSGTPVPQWPALLQHDLGQRVVSLTTAGSGYTTRPLTSLFGGTFRARAKQVATTSKVVLIVGGANDQGSTRVQLLRAASDAISSAQARAPKATVVIVGPPSPQAVAPSTLLAVRDTLSTAASRGGARFVDPIAQGWLNPGTGYLAPDDRTLTAKGQQALAARIESVVRPLL